MAEAQIPNDALIQDSQQPKPAFDVTFTGFLTYKAPFETPTLELKYELDYSLSDIINTFKSMVFEDIESLPDDMKGISTVSLFLYFVTNIPLKFCVIICCKQNS